MSVDLIALAVAALAFGGRWAWTQYKNRKTAAPGQVVPVAPGYTVPPLGVPQPGQPVPQPAQPAEPGQPCPNGPCPLADTHADLMAPVSETDQTRIRLVRDIIAGPDTPVNKMTDVQRRAILRIAIQGGSPMDAVAFLRDRGQADTSESPQSAE